MMTSQEKLEMMTITTTISRHQVYFNDAFDATANYYLCSMLWVYIVQCKRDKITPVLLCLLAI